MISGIAIGVWISGMKYTLLCSDFFTQRWVVMRDLEASAVDRLCRAEHWTKVDYKITSNIFALSENWNLGGGGAGRQV